MTKEALDGSITIAYFLEKQAHKDRGITTLEDLEFRSQKLITYDNKEHDLTGIAAGKKAITQKGRFITAVRFLNWKDRQEGNVPSGQIISKSQDENGEKVKTPVILMTEDGQDFEPNLYRDERHDKTIELPELE